MPVFWAGEVHGQRSLAGYSLWGHKESDMTERRSLLKTPGQWSLRDRAGDDRPPTLADEASPGTPTFSVPP